MLGYDCAHIKWYCLYSTSLWCRDYVPARDSTKTQIHLMEFRSKSHRRRVVGGKNEKGRWHWPSQSTHNNVFQVFVWICIQPKGKYAILLASVRYDAIICTSAGLFELLVMSETNARDIQLDAPWPVSNRMNRMWHGNNKAPATSHLSSNYISLKCAYCV